ncbi:MAG: tRNA dihydrouridine synthase DusB, partial [Clostridia bacterium]|nr:tRNA dihydrouridine synthase DusB [Clostridia bacterium]
MLTFGNIKLPYGLFLAPLAGYTDTAMRRVCREYGAEYTVSEMVSAKALCYHDKKTPLLARVEACDLPSAVQIFGSEPDSMAEAAKMVAEGMAGGVPPSAIDINMGCPVKKIVSAGDGSALMKDPDLVFRIVSSVSAAVTLPVTVKIRAGWDEGHKNAVEVARAAEAGGAALVAVHGRTKSQMYSGKADLAIIADVKKALQIPVVGNGDIASATDALRMKEETGCDGVMIGRGAVGNPFLFAEIRAALDGVEYTPPTAEERVETALRQLRLAAEEKGEHTAVTESRKQFADYLHGLRGAAAVRGRINAA